MGMYDILCLKGNALIKGLDRPLFDVCYEVGGLYYETNDYRKPPAPLFGIDQGFANVQVLHLSSKVFVIHKTRTWSNRRFNVKNYKEALHEEI